MNLSKLASASSIVGLAFVAGCSGQVLSIGEIDQPIGTGAGPGAVSPTGWDIPSCAAPTGAIHTYTSIADTEAHIGGAWFLCEGGIGSPSDTTGIEISSGKANYLVTSGTGLVHGASADYRRDVSFVDTTAMNGPGKYQINFTYATGGQNMYFSRASEDGKFLELNEGTSGKQARYVRATPRAPRAADCSTPIGTPHAYTSAADVGARITGKWKICSGSIASPADTAGVRFSTTDAHFLVAGSGGLVEVPSWDYERTLEIIDTTMMNGAGSYQINLSAAGTNMYSSRISESGERLELDEGTSGKKVSYLRVP